jgi:dUTP pyrophosphatase
VSAHDPGRARVLFTQLPEGQDLEAPRRATDHSAGLDLRARVDGELRIDPGERVLIPTGIALALPPGYEAQVRPRSGLAWNRGLTVLNGPGTVDSDYRGEVRVILINHGRETSTVRRGDRIAQLVVQRLPEVEWHEAEALPESGRGAGGFGHTGER